MEGRCLVHWAGAGSGKACLHSPGAAGTQRAELQTLGFQPVPIMCPLILSEAGRLFLCFGERESNYCPEATFFPCVD